MTDLRQKHLDWLITMSKNPGAKAHAWQRAQELDKDDSGIFTGIASELEAHMLKLKEQRPKNGG